MADRWAGMAFVLVGLAQAGASLSLGLGTAREPGAGLLPFLTGGLLGTLGLALALRSWRGTPGARREATASPFPTRLMFVAGTLLTYPLLLERGGFLFMTTILLVAILRAFSGARLGRHVGVAAILVLASYLVFSRWLGVPLPRGFVPF